MKLSFEISGEWSRRFALLTHIINAMDSIAAEYGCTDTRLCYPIDLREVSGSDLDVCFSNCDLTPSKGFELDNAKEYGLISGYSLRPCTSDTCLSSDVIYRELLNCFKDLISYVRPYALKTALEGVEFISIVLRNGRAALLEGEEGKVRLPDIGIIASAHTHPRGCIPSPHDIKTLINTLFNGGAGMAIVSTECSLVIMRFGPFTEEDFLELQKLRSVLRKGNSREIEDIINRGVVGKNLKVIASPE